MCGSDRMCRCRGVGRVRHSRLKPAPSGRGRGRHFLLELHVPASDGIRVSLRPADPARIGRHRGGPHRGLLRRGGARAGGGAVIGSPSCGTSDTRLGSSDRLCLVRGPGTCARSRRIPRSAGAPRQDVVAGARDRTSVAGAWDRTWWPGPETGRGGRAPGTGRGGPGPGTGRGGRGPGIAVSPPTASCLRSPDPGPASDQDAADRPSAPSLRPGRSDHRRGSSAHGEPIDPVDPACRRRRRPERGTPVPGGRVLRWVA